MHRGVLRWVWFAAGWLAVGVGGLGVVVPGLPTTVFFIMAAACFSRSSPRFERWVLELPRIGPLVRDYRNGLGMPQRAKRFAIGTIVAVSLVSGLFALDDARWRLALAALAAVGVAYVGWVVPTRERVLARRAAGAGVGDGAVAFGSTAGPGSAGPVTMQGPGPGAGRDQ